MKIIALFICLVFFTQIALAQGTDAIKSEIYSQLKCCACQLSFDKCVCPESKEMKAYIDALLESGVSKEEIFYKIAKKYSLDMIIDKQIKANVEQRLIKESGGKRPQIIIEPVSFDFGKVSKRQGKISKNFKLHNRGNANLIIKNMKTSCPCATLALEINKNKTPYFGTDGSPKDWQAEIKPEETGGLELVVDLASAHVKPGELIREATVTSNDPLYPETTLKIKADVQE